MNIKKTLISAGLVGLLAMPIGCREKQEIITPALTESPKYEEPVQELVEKEYNFKSQKGNYEVPLKVSQDTVVLSPNIIEYVMEKGKNREWVYVPVPINETENSGGDLYMKAYPSKDIASQLIINWTPKSDMSLEEQVDELITLVPMSGNTYLAGSKSNIKLDKENAIKFELSGKPNKIMIFATHNNRVYNIIFQCYKIGGENKKDPENSLEKIEKGLKFID
jgi:hypothetical protein